MKLLTFTKVRLDGEDCKLIPLGKVACDADSIIGFFEVEDKFDVPVKNALVVRSKQGDFLVKETFDSMFEKLAEVTI